MQRCDDGCAVQACGQIHKGRDCFLITSISESGKKYMVTTPQLYMYNTMLGLSLGKLCPHSEPIRGGCHEHTCHAGLRGVLETLRRTLTVRTSTENYIHPPHTTALIWTRVIMLSACTHKHGVLGHARKPGVLGSVAPSTPACIIFVHRLLKRKSMCASCSELQCHYVNHCTVMLI